MIPRRVIGLIPGVLGGLLMVVGGTVPAFAAAPRLILVTDGRLTRPEVLADWPANLTIMEAASQPADARTEHLAARPSYRIAMFWGPRWDEYMHAGKDPAALRSTDADQQGSYYPPEARTDAVLAIDVPGSEPRLLRLDKPGIAVFSGHGLTAKALARKAVSGQSPAGLAGSPVGLPLTVALIVGAMSIVAVTLVGLILRRSRT